MKTLVKANAKALAAATLCQANGDVRYYLNGIFIKPNDGGGIQLASTDGHRLLVVTDKTGWCDKKSGIIIKLDAQAVTKMKTKAFKNVEILKVDDELTIAKATGMTKTRVVQHVSEVNVIDGRFPDYEKSVLPDKLPEKSCSTATINPLLLIEFAQASKLLARVRYNAISLVNGATENDSVIVRFGKCDDGLHARGVLMPLRTDLDSWKP